MSFVYIKDLGGEETKIRIHPGEMIGNLILRYEEITGKLVREILLSDCEEPLSRNSTLEANGITNGSELFVFIADDADKLFLVARLATSLPKCWKDKEHKLYNDNNFILNASVTYLFSDGYRLITYYGTTGPYVWTGVRSNFLIYKNIYEKIGDQCNVKELGDFNAHLSINDQKPSLISLSELVEKGLEDVVELEGDQFVDEHEELIGDLNMIYEFKMGNIPNKYIKLIIENYYKLIGESEDENIGQEELDIEDIIGIYDSYKLEKTNYRNQFNKYRYLIQDQSDKYQDSLTEI